MTNTSKRVDVAGYNIFCAGFVQLANGNVFVAGGNLNTGLAGIRQTHVFDWRTETWSRGPDMQDGRWYPSVASMPNDEALIIGGGPTVAEIRTTSGEPAAADRLHASIAAASTRSSSAIPDGRALLLGPGPCDVAHRHERRRDARRGRQPGRHRPAATAATRLTTSAASWWPAAET